MDIPFLYQQWLLYLKSGQAVSSHTLAAYQQDWQQFATFFQNHLGQPLTLEILKSLTITDLRAWLADRHHQNFHNRSTARSLSGVKSFFTYLQQENLLENHPLLALKSPRLKKTLPRPLSVQQIMDLLDHIHQVSDKAWVGQRDRSLFMLLYSAGLRISEALGLNYKDLSSGDYLIIHGKGEKFRKVPYLEKVKNELQQYCQLCPFAFTEETPLFLGVKGKRLATGIADQQMRTYRHLVGLPEWATPHALRHSCATHLMESSSDLRGIQELLGHASLSTTQIYTDINQDYLMKAYKNARPRG